MAGGSVEAVEVVIGDSAEVVIEDSVVGVVEGAIEVEVDVVFSEVVVVSEEIDDLLRFIA